jgi:hypothetical protein
MTAHRGPVARRGVNPAAWSGEVTGFVRLVRVAQAERYLQRWPESTSASPPVRVGLSKGPPLARSLQLGYLWSRVSRLTSDSTSVLITTINHSGHPIRINSAGLELQDGSGDWSIKPSIPSGAGLFGVVAPNDSADTTQVNRGVT